MTDELLESLDRLTDYVEEVWSSAQGWHFPFIIIQTEF